MKAPLPPDEAQRLETLRAYDVLDTPPEQSFDDLALLAAHICQAPIAAISLVDERRQWFKSKIGLGVAETPRDLAFCAHTILQPGEVLEVPDALLDPRFADNPLVTADPHIRFYAGAPLVAPGGHALGTLCVIDRAPRELDASRKQALRALSHQVVTLLELRRSLNERNILDERAHLVAEAAPSAMVMVDATGRITLANAQAEKLFGYSRAELIGQKIEMLVPERFRAAHPRYRDGFFADPRPRAMGAGRDLFGLRKDGREVPVEIGLNPLVARDGTFALASIIDISERRQAEARLREIMALQRAILDNAGHAIISTTPDGRITSFNPAAERMLGYTAAEVIGTQTPAIIDPAEVAARAEQFSAELGETIAPGFEVFVARARRSLPNEYEWTCIRKDGTRFPVLLTVTALHDDAGGITGFLGLAVDIAQRKQDEARLRQLSRAVEQSPASVVIADSAGDIEYVNPRFTEVTGYTMAEVLGRNPRMWKSGDKSPEEYRELWQTITSGKVWRGEFHNRKKNGEIFWESASISPIRDATGSITHYVAVKEDITERKRDEDVRQQLTRQLQLLLESTGEGIYGIDLEGKFTFVNQAALNLLGYQLEELLGRNAHEVIHHTRNDGSPYPVGECPIFLAFRTARGSRRDDEVLWRKDGTSFPAEYASYPILQDGRCEGAVVTFNDISVRKRSEKLILEKNEELKGFAYTVSHDLKAPLRGISGYAQELERRHREGLSDRAQFCITQIITASRNLDALIEDLLKYSRLDTDIPTQTEVNLPELVQRILRDRTHTLAEMKVEVSVNVPPIILRTWERGLHQVLANLIDNAVKYSRHAQPPRLTIGAEAADGTCRISVADNGIGFDMKYHDRIFGLFNRLVRADEFEGTGAGLAIVRKLMEKLGGSVRAESAPGQGAAFFVELPISSAGELPS